jgi:serine phosphatase RsbU (regulator of sigma subunit)
MTGTEPLDALPADVNHAIRALTHLAPDDLPGLLRTALRPGVVSSASVYLTDYRDLSLVPLGPAPTPELGQPLAVDDSLAGRAFLDQRAVADGRSLWLPLTDRQHRLGVLRVELVSPAAPSPDAVTALLRLADLIAAALESARPGTDSFARARRRGPITLTAEMQWSLLPPTCLSGAGVTLAGRLEPAYTVGGDSFDYSINTGSGRRDGGSGVAHIGIFDPLGHDLRATLLSALAVGTFRHARRERVPLEDTGPMLDTSISSQFRDDCFVTGILAELDLDTGAFSWANAGHPLPLLLRDGRVSQLQLRPDPPWGLRHHSSRTAQLRLRPGDRVLMYTDGVVEARPAGGEPFGYERLARLLIRESQTERGLPVLLRNLLLEVIEHRNAELTDDASAVLVEWQGPVAS